MIRLHARVGRALALSIVAGLLAIPSAATAAIAAGATAPHQIDPVLTAYTDSEQPNDAFPVADGDLPVGAWADATGTKHLSRTYVTFDLSRFTGRQITKATLIMQEASVADCTAPRAVEVWRVAATNSAPTWANAPEPSKQYGTLPVTDGCPDHYLTIDVVAPLRQAQADGASAATLMLRVPQAQEDNLAAGRRIVDPWLLEEDNGTPGVPSNVSVGGVSCTSGGIFVGTTTPEFMAWVTDPDQFDQVRPTFAYWPADRPAERTEVTGAAVGGSQMGRAQVPTALVDSGVYLVAVRATDAAGASSAWSAACQFTVDIRVPKAPSVSSTDYPATGGPHGGPGIAGKFTFAIAPTDTDVVAFRYNADQIPVGPDGTATIEWTPTWYGTQSLTVWGIDRAGNQGKQTVYSFTVRNTEVKITDHDPDAGFGQPHTVTFAPGMPDVVSYTYWLGGGEQTTVSADADGTATVVVTPDQPGYNYLYVTSRTSNGLPSAKTEKLFYLETTPTVTSPDFPTDGTAEPPLVGTEVTLTFHPGMPGVTEWVWSTQFSDEQVVPADPDGTATVHWTTKNWPYLFLTFRSRTAGGVESATAEAGWELTSHAPTVTSTDYPENQTSGGVGVAGTFVFGPARPGVTAYTYTFADGVEHTIPAEQDGTAAITWTPTAADSGWQTLTVREHLGDLVSDNTEYGFRVAG